MKETHLPKMENLPNSGVTAGVFFMIRDAGEHLHLHC